MKKIQWPFYLLCLYILCSTHIVHANGQQSLTQLPFTSGETLHYKLSYRGILTSMIWADIADASMTFLANQTTADAQSGHQFILSLSTENYKKAEIIQAVRYTYITTLDKTLKKTLLIEEVDAGENQSHDFLWIDWQKNETHLFKKREKELLSSGFFELETQDAWEKDGQLPLPKFLLSYPVLENNLTYFIHKEAGDRIKQSQLLDPLSLIYTLRTLDSNNIDNNIEFPVAISDDIRLYQIENHGLEILELGGGSYQSVKYKIQTNEKKDNHYFVWLNNDEKKIPLRLAMNAPLGKLTIELMKVTQENVLEKKRKLNPLVKLDDKVIHY